MGFFLKPNLQGRARSLSVWVSPLAPDKLYPLKYWERISTNADGTIANSFVTHPDWTIEILSPDQLATRVRSNIFHCLNHGTELGWLIDPGEELILTYNLNSPPGLFEIGNDVLLPVPSFLPHLQLTASQIFGWLRIRGQ